MKFLSIALVLLFSGIASAQCANGVCQMPPAGFRAPVVRPSVLVRNIVSRPVQAYRYNVASTGNGTLVYVEPIKLAPGEVLASPVRYQRGYDVRTMNLGLFRGR